MQPCGVVWGLGTDGGAGPHRFSRVMVAVGCLVFSQVGQSASPERDTQQSKWMHLWLAQGVT